MRGFIDLAGVIILLLIIFGLGLGFLGILPMGLGEVFRVYVFGLVTFSGTIIFCGSIRGSACSIHLVKNMPLSLRGLLF